MGDSILTAMVLGAAMMALAVLAVSGANAAEALSPAAQRGLTFVRTNCASCHAIGKAGDSRLKIAPPLRVLHLRYPVENLSEAFAEGIVTGHPTMPEFQLEPDQISDVIAYLKSLER